MDYLFISISNSTNLDYTLVEFVFSWLLGNANLFLKHGIKE